jgi:acid phosphatase type 7
MKFPHEVEMIFRRFYSLVILTLFTLSLGGQTITRGPYLADPKTGEMSIRWEVDQKSSGRVYYGQDKSLKQSVKAVLLGAQFDHFLYEAELKELSPGADYFYQVKVKRKRGTLGHFQAPPELDATCTFAISGDSRSNPQIFTKIVAGIAQTNPDFVISMGDLVADGGNYNQWNENYFIPAAQLIAERPFISTLGDHEAGGDDGALFEHFLFPDLEYEKLWYSFDYGMVHFISLDYRHVDSEEMKTWFQEDIQSSKGKWNIVFMHRPTYNLGGHRSFWGNPVWPDLFQEYEIDVVFAGHSHIYERFHPVYKGKAGNWSVTYVTTGGSGAGLYEAVQHPVLAFAKSINHYADVHVSDEQFELRVYQIDGGLLDSLTISKNTDGSQDSQYLASASSRDELDVMSRFARPISRSLESPPLLYRPAAAIVKLKAGAITSPVKFELRLSDVSLENYKMVPYSGELIPGVDQEVTLSIYGLSDLKISSWGHIDPPFRIEAIYEQGDIKGTVEGKLLSLRAW